MSKSRSVSYLTGAFLGWKTLLLLVAHGAPGVGYDTSTNLLPETNKLVRWDAIYFVQMAYRGHVFEQEWAFGLGISTLLSTLSFGSLKSIATTGVLVAHISHYITIIALWHIAAIVMKHEKSKFVRQAVPFLACCLHILAPAGIFLSAPYTESPFAALNMLGFWLYLEARSSEERTSLIGQFLLLLAVGVCFGAATVLRSNGVLSGLPLLLDAIVITFEILKPGNKSLWAQAVLLTGTVMAGTLIAAGLAIPQYLAYQDYCSAAVKQPWCFARFPLIYSYVQSHYWGVGFLRYWKLSNVPLFLLASPMLVLLLYSGATSLTKRSFRQAQIHDEQTLVFRLVLPQLVLASLAVTNYHVQIITRLSSGYPWLYIWLAKQICEGSKYSASSVRFFILYALIQAVLFASFLPPA